MSRSSCQQRSNAPQRFYVVKCRTPSTTFTRLCYSPARHVRDAAARCSNQLRSKTARVLVATVYAFMRAPRASSASPRCRCYVAVTLSPGWHSATVICSRRLQTPQRFSGKERTGPDNIMMLYVAVSNESRRERGARGNHATLYDKNRMLSASPDTVCSIRHRHGAFFDRYDNTTDDPLPLPPRRCRGARASGERRHTACCFRCCALRKVAARYARAVWCSRQRISEYA